MCWAGWSRNSSTSITCRCRQLRRADTTTTTLKHRSSSTATISTTRWTRSTTKMSIRMVFNNQFYSYYSFRPPANFTKKIRSWTAIFYLNDLRGNRNHYINFYSKLSQMSGIKISVHAPGDGSHIEMAWGIASGTETLVHVSQTAYLRLPEPYGACTNQLNLTSVNVQNGDHLNTVDTCFGLCMQQLFVDTCHCLNFALPYNESQGHFRSYCNFSMIDPEVIKSDWPFGTN